MILRVACYVSYLKTAEAASQTVYNIADILKFSKVCTFWKNISSFFGYNL